MSDRQALSRAIEAWRRELAGRSAVDAAAEILSDLIGYRKTRRDSEDTVNLAHALEAYAALHREGNG